MSVTAYPPPVDRLLTIGDPHQSDPPRPELPDFEAMQEQGKDVQDLPHVPRPFASAHWPDYPATYGLGPEHVPDLLRLAEAITFWALEDEDDPAGWGPLHAWRALGQLRAEEAVKPLRALLEPLRDNDWFQEEVTEVFGMIGAAAIAPLTVFLNDPRHEMYTRATAGSSIAAIGRMHPDARAESIAALAGQIEASLDYPDPDEDLVTLNGFLITDLMDVGATEAMPTVRRAFEADLVDETIGGDLEDVEIGFGVRESRDTPRPRYGLLRDYSPGGGPGDPYGPGGGSGASRVTAPVQKAKRKQKIAKASRRKNRNKR